MQLYFELIVSIVLQNKTLIIIKKKIEDFLYAIEVQWIYITLQKELLPLTHIIRPSFPF